jgi:hypothetical protein
MQLNKIVLIGIFLMCISTVSAWDTESELYDNETLNIGFNPILNESEANNPYPYGIYPDLMNDALLMPSLSSLDPTTMCVSYKIYKQIWDGSNYIQINTCNISIESCVNLQYNSVTNMYELPDNWAAVQSNGFLVKKYFQDLINSDSAYCSEWNSSNDEFPDVFYTVIDVDVNDGNEHVAYMYTSVSDADIKTMSDNTLPDYGDYGLGSSGRGSDAGSGGIYTGINVYSNTDDSTAQTMGDSFKSLFYIGIPILFAICAIRFISKVIKND